MRAIELAITLAIGVLVGILIAPHLRSGSKLPTKDPSERHDYHVELTGTEGTRMRVLIVTRQDPAASLSKREETVTVPAKIRFPAYRCIAWAETLPDGEGRDDTADCTLVLRQDGDKMGTVEMGPLSKTNMMSGSVGDL
jgi:hypothetical protein